jgi:hypothetical protein
MGYASSCLDAQTPPLILTGASVIYINVIIHILIYCIHSIIIYNQSTWCFVTIGNSGDVKADFRISALMGRATRSAL